MGCECNISAKAKVVFVAYKDKEPKQRYTTFERAQVNEQIVFKAF